MNDYRGQYIIVNELNPFFNHVTRMLQYHFDRPEYENHVFILGTYVYWPASLCESEYPGKTCIFYNLEPLREGADGWQSAASIVANLSGAQHVWDQDAASAQFLASKGILVERIQPMLYTPSLREVPNVPDKDIDVLFYGYVNERRFPILRALEPLFYNRHSLVWLYGVGYDKLIGYLARTKIVLNLHVSDNLQQQEQVRIFYPLINGICVVSEPSETNHFGNAIIESPNYLADTLSDLLSSGRWETAGAGGQRMFEASCV